VFQGYEGLELEGFLTHWSPSRKYSDVMFHLLQARGRKFQM